MKSIKNLLAIVSIGLVLPIQAQIVSQNFYGYRLDNMFNANPAYTGSQEGVNFIFNALSQNDGVSFANKNFMAGMHTPLSETQGIGARLISDSRGAFQVFKGDITYSYNLKINDLHKLRMGLSAGILNNSLQTSRIQNFDRIDQSDAALYLPYLNSVQFAAGFGFLYEFENLQVSVAMPDLMSTNQSIISYLNAASFYTIEAGDKFKFTPWFNYQRIPVIDDLIGGFLKVGYQEKLWLQAGYQNNKSVAVMAGFKWEQFSLGYGFNFNNEAFSVVSSGFHELSFKLSLNSNSKNNSSNKTISSLGEILNDLTRLAEMEVTEENREKVQADLKELKKRLLEVEIDNSDPKNAEKVEKQLNEINEQLKILETKLK